MLDKYTSVGCYPLFYVTAVYNDCLCAECATSSATKSTPEVNWESPDLYCDECSQRIESAYAESEGVS